MSKMSVYFSENRYKPVYFLGDRLRGIHEGVPFVGTVLIDSLPYTEGESMIHISLDLPVKINNTWRTMISVKHDCVQLLK